MPRSVNNVASRNRRRKILKLAKGYFGARKNVYTVAKTQWKKVCYMPIPTEKIKRELSEDFGLPESMPA